MDDLEHKSGISPQRTSAKELSFYSFVGLKAKTAIERVGNNLQAGSKWEKLKERLRRPAVSRTQNTPEIENIDEFFEVEDKKTKIKEKLDQWTQEQLPILQKRMEVYGMTPQEVSKVIDGMKLNISVETYDLFDHKNFDKLCKKALTLTANIKPEEMSKAEDINQKLKEMNLNSFLGLIIRKLDGDIDDSEKFFLDYLLYAHNGGTLGTHGTLSGINLSLLSRYSLKDMTITLQHEWTHAGLDKAVPLAFWFNAALKTQKKEGTMKVPEGISPELIQSFALGINESAAFTIGRYFEGPQEPPYTGYADKINPLLFKKIYESISSLAQGRSVEEFDKAVIILYRNFVHSFDQNLTNDTFKQAITNFVSTADLMVIKE